MKLVEKLRDIYLKKHMISPSLVIAVGIAYMEGFRAGVRISAERIRKRSWGGVANTVEKIPDEEVENV